MIRPELAKLATDRGATALLELVRWHYRKQPRSLKRLEAAHTRLCVLLYCALLRKFPATRFTRSTSRPA